ncbi:Uma2 family endonuclease [Kibdelosporangium persicum]|uniref:Restriction endonuclease n=2 Tax=Kibdelosporangium persicum TaxID=2698649 RepID=A0ABX2EWV7_9PSEU|nr:Restriction endonuclease [Kibdelosporangium persicum]
MTALPDWMVLPPEGLTAERYEALPEDVCRRVEIVDGAIVVNAAPRRLHQLIARRLANVLEESCGTGLAVATDVDLRLRDIPLLNRRPDIVVYDSTLPDDALLRPQHCHLVVEVMSPGSVTTDQTDKPAEYATAGIEHFWRVENVHEDAAKLAVFRYRLDPTTGSYASAGVSTGTMVVDHPVTVTIDLGELV